MDAEDLQQGFQLGDWRVAPDKMQLAGPLGTRTLQPVHFRLLLAKASALAAQAEVEIDPAQPYVRY
jgi:hypothetical protein